MSIRYTFCVASIIDLVGGLEGQKHLKIWNKNDVQLRRKPSQNNVKQLKLIPRFTELKKGVVD